MTEVISPKELDSFYETNSSLELIDVRTPAEFQEVHVKYAKNLPLDRLDVDSFLASRSDSSTEPVYIICKSGSRGQMACKKFEAAGFDDVYNVEGGTMACEQAGVSVVRGKKVMSLERQVRIAAGLFVLVGAILALTLDPNWALLSGFVGAGLIFAGITDTCGMGMLLAKMPWNQIGSSCSASSCKV